MPADSSVPAAPLAGPRCSASNDVPEVDGRVYLFVLDDYSAEAADTLKVRNLMHGFIHERLSANDLAAISIVGGARAQNFTRNRQLLHEAVDRFIGDRDDDTQLEIPESESALTKIAGLRTQQTLNAITRMAQWLGSIKGRRKALVLITSSAICSLSSDECREPLQSTLARDDAGRRQYLRRRSEGSQRLRAFKSREQQPQLEVHPEIGYTEASSRDAARAAFTEGRRGLRGPLDGARYLAEESGGIAVVNTNDLQRGLERIVRDTSSYYLLGYHSTNNRADGKFRRNEVTVARKDARVVHRNGYFAARQARACRFSARAWCNHDCHHGCRSWRAARYLSVPCRCASPPRRSSPPTTKPGSPSSSRCRLEGLKPVTEDGRYRLNIALRSVSTIEAASPWAATIPRSIWTFRSVLRRR